MANRLLTEEELGYIDSDASNFGSAITEYADNIQKVVNSFNNANIVQAFYSTGKFGQAQRERLANICNALRKYVEIVSDSDGSLVVQTKNYVARQRALNSAGQSAGAGVGGAVRSGMISGGISNRLG